MPLVSVIIPTYNRSGMLEQALRSVYAQTFKDFELIVVDDGSTDNTAKVMEKYARQIKYLPKKNGGVASARNLGLKAATGDLVAWLDDDDYFLPDKLEKQVKYMALHPEVGLVYTGMLMIDTTGIHQTRTYIIPPHYKSCSEIRNVLARNCFFGNSTVMMRKECFDRAGFFDENLKHTVDYDMWLRVAAYFRFGCVPEVLAVYRWHGRQISMHRDNRILPVLRKKAKKLYAEIPCPEVE